jgi:hypothetical protein
MTTQRVRSSVSRAKRKCVSVRHAATNPDTDVTALRRSGSCRQLTPLLLLLLASCRLGVGDHNAVTADGSGGEGSSEVAVAAIDPAPRITTVERQQWVRAPDEMQVATIEVVDAEAAGLLRSDNGTRVLALHQSACRFVEAEPDATFEANDALGCRKYMYEELPHRSHRALRLGAGRVVLEVTNEGVAHEVGIWLRRESDGTVIATGGGIAPGASGRYDVELVAGRYLYSCPLNPTPAYLIVVE